MKSRVLRFEQEVFDWLLGGLGWDAFKRIWNAARSRFRRATPAPPMAPTGLHAVVRDNLGTDKVSWVGTEEITRPEPPEVL